jgi:phage shock protein E
MKKLIIITLSLLVIGVLAWIFIPDNSNNTSATPITNSAQRAVSELATGKAIIYDVRTPEEFNSKHVANAINFNVEDMQRGSLPQVPKDSNIYVYCRSGNRSAEAKQILNNNGFANVTDLGGLSALQSAGVL